MRVRSFELQADYTVTSTSDYTTDAVWNIDDQNYADDVEELNSSAISSIAPSTNDLESLASDAQTPCTEKHQKLITPEMKKVARQRKWRPCLASKAKRSGNGLFCTKVDSTPQNFVRSKDCDRSVDEPHAQRPTSLALQKPFMSSWQSETVVHTSDDENSIDVSEFVNIYYIYLSL